MRSPTSVSQCRTGENRPGEASTSTSTRLGRNVPETQANVFASNLLMPAAAFKAAFKELGEDLVAVADRFEVSVPAAKVRAEFLSLPV